MKHLMLMLLFVWHLLSTQFFGWNWTPQSAEEYICDGLLIVGFLIYYCSFQTTQQVK